jgi:hypothetical protein
MEGGHIVLHFSPDLMSLAQAEVRPQTRAKKVLKRAKPHVIISGR